MKTTTITIIISSFLVIATAANAYAAHMYIQAPKTASSNGVPLSFSIFLDPEQDTVSGVSGDLSFQSNLFQVDSISANGSIVPLWAVSPHVSNEKFFDQKTHITFEGIIPGGFNGVRSAYYKGVQPGAIFTITLIPKGSGSGEFTLSNVELHAYDQAGTLIKTTGDKSAIYVPTLTGNQSTQSTALKPITSDTLLVALNKSDIVDNNASYIYVHDANPSLAIDHIEVAESDEYDASHVNKNEWHTVTNPYVLEYQSRTKYIHVKAVYTNNTFAIESIPPVENSQAFPQSSRILVYIIVAIFLVLHYGKNLLYFFQKSRRKLV